MVKCLSASAVAFTYNVQHDSHYQPQDGPPPLPLTTMSAKTLDCPPVASLVAKIFSSGATCCPKRTRCDSSQSTRPGPSSGTIGITLAGRHLEHPLPPTSVIIAPPVSSGWFRAPAPSPPLECSPWARPFARSGPLYLLGSPEISRSSTWGFSAQNLKQGPQKKI